MLKKTQSISPVTAPRRSNPTAVFSQVRDSVNERLHFTIKNINSIPQNIAAGRAPLPHAKVTNENVAQVLGFEPLPGRQSARQMHLDVFKAEPIRVDAVADAIQRYFNIKPRREPTSDPRDEASVARHPQQLLWEYTHWAEPYQWSVNGMKMQGFHSEFNAWGGTLRTNLQAPGSTGIATGPSHSPMPGRAVSTNMSATGYDPAMAAQEAMSKIAEIVDKPKMEFHHFGPPIISDDPYFDPAYAAQNAMQYIRRLLDKPQTELLPSGGGTKAAGDISSKNMHYALSAHYKIPLQQGDFMEKQVKASIFTSAAANRSDVLRAYYGPSAFSQSFGTLL